MKIKSLLLSALALAGLGAVTPITPVQATASASREVKLGLPKTIASRPASRRLNIVGASNANPYKHQKRGFLDQKSKREKLRSNPSFKRSKKCTTKTKGR